MYSHYNLATKYLKYYLSASNGKGHGIHSPFVFDFVQNVLNDRRHFYMYERIESLRAQLRKNNNKIEVADYGAGSGFSNKKYRSVKAIASSALKAPKYGQLLFRMIHHYGPENMIELGSSLGVTTAYLASAGSNAKVVTMEGAPEIAACATDNFARLGLQNIEMVVGNFDTTLQPTLSMLGKIDFAFVDGNHQKAPTLRYFDQLLGYSHEHTILVFDDIHWSKEMEAAWSHIISDKRITLSIDLFFIGIVFFKKDFKEKQNFAIRF